MAPPPMTTMRGRDVVEVEHLVARHDRAAPLEVGDQPWHRAGGKDHAAARDLGRRAVAGRDGDGVVGTEAADAVEHLDLAPLAHRGDAADEAGDDLVLAGLGDGEVDGRRAGLDAEVGGVLDVAVDRGRLEERLGRDAATVEARPAEGIHLDDRHLDACRRCVERGGVPTGTSADHHEIELLGRRDHLFRSGVATPLPGLRCHGSAVRRSSVPVPAAASSVPPNLLVSAPVQQHAAAAVDVGNVERQGATLRRHRRAGARRDLAGPVGVARPEGRAGDDEAELGRPVRVVDAAQLEHHDRLVVGLGDVLHGHHEVADLHRGADERRRRRIVLPHDAQQLHHAGDEDQQPASDGQQQEGAGAHAAQDTSGRRQAGADAPYARSCEVAHAGDGAGRGRGGLRAGRRPRRVDHVGHRRPRHDRIAPRPSPRRCSSPPPRWAAAGSTAGTTPAGTWRCGSGRRIEASATGKPPRSRRPHSGGPGRSTWSAWHGRAPTTSSRASSTSTG